MYFREIMLLNTNGLNYIMCTSIKKHEHFHSHLFFLLQIYFVSVNGYRCDKDLD